jgi:molybdate transport system permease protein
LVAVCGIFLLFLLLPLATLLVRAVPGLLTGVWQHPAIASALQLSLWTSTCAMLLSVLLGTPVAYVLARYRFFGAALLDTLVDLPVVLPPAVAGMALLATFGRNGVVGQHLTPWGIELPFTAVAVVMAQTFVATSLYVRAGKSAFTKIDERVEQASAILGHSPWHTFYQVTLPLARNALLGGAVMAWARALGEFGATMIFAGNFSGRTQTMPLAIYTAMQADVNVALTLGAILLGVSFGVLGMLRFLGR